MRQLLEERDEHASRRLEEIDAALRELDAVTAVGAAVVDAEAIADRLNRLGEILGTDHAARLNLELAWHVDGIHCHPDGTILVRTCRLGALAASELVAPPERPRCPSSDPKQGRPTRRALRHLDSADGGPELRDRAEFAADPRRFARLGPEWFHEDRLTLPPPTFWSSVHAAEVAAARAEGLTHERLAERFGVTEPTIRHALELARERGLISEEHLRKRSPGRWEDTHYLEVAAAQAAGLTLKQLAKQLGKSQPTISKALKRARSIAAPDEGGSGSLA